MKSGETVEKVQHRVLQRIREAKSKSPCIRTDVDEIVVSINLLSKGMFFSTSLTIGQDKIDGLKDRLDLLQSNMDTIVDVSKKNFSRAWKCHVL